MYARMLTEAHKVPDFKARLTDMRKKKSKNIPGFGAINRAGKKTENL